MLLLAFTVVYRYTTMNTKSNIVALLYSLQVGQKEKAMETVRRGEIILKAATGTRVEPQNHRENYSHHCEGKTN